MPVKRIKLPSKGESSKRELFDYPSQESKGRLGSVVKKVEGGQKTNSAQLASSSTTLKDMSSFEWAIKYQDNNRRVILYLGKIIGASVILGGDMFSYGKILKVGYQDDDSLPMKFKLKHLKGGMTCYYQRTCW